MKCMDKVLSKAAMGGRLKRSVFALLEQFLHLRFSLLDRFLHHISDPFLPFPSHIRIRWM